MSRFAAQPLLSDEQRSLQALEAARSERRSRPMHLIILALVVVAISLLVLFSASASLAKARRTLRFQRNTAEEVSQSVAKLRQLREATVQTGPTGNEELSDLRSKVAGAAAETGVTSLRGGEVLPTTKTDPQRPGLNSVQHKFTYDVKAETPAALLRWMELAATAVPGLEVYSLKVMPEPQFWHVQVTFSRWQRVDNPT